MAYTYATYTASNGVKLVTMKTSPNNVYMTYIGKTAVSAQSKYGVNGGFFYDSDILSIAANNGVPINGSNGTYGSGYKNEKYNRGTLVWDTKAAQFSVQVVSTIDNLNVLSKNQYWAQGGVSMGLNNESGWKARANAENLPGIDGLSARTGLVYNNTNNIWLVVSTTVCTAAAFRTAIKEKVGSGTLVNGIFLDGGGSSEYKAAEGSFGGTDPSPRAVYSMVALRS